MNLSAPRTIVAAIVVSLLILVGAGGFGGLPAHAADAPAAGGDVTWTVRTASNSFGADRTNFSHSINPGSRVADALVVTNDSTTPLDLAVYAADGFTTESGQFDLLTRDAESVGVGAWVHAAQDDITIKPGQSVEVPFTVDVPDDATPGDYAGGIVTSLGQADATEGINVDRRLGIRVNLHIGGEITPTMTVEDLHLDYDGTLNPFATGDATLTYTIHNTGNAILSAQQAASVAGPFGWLKADAGEVDAPPQLLPGESWEVSVPVQGVSPAVRVAGTVTVTPLFTDASGSTTRLDPVVVSAHGWAIPWALVAFVVLVALALVGVRILRRRARARQKAREEVRLQEAVAHALRERESQVP